MADVFAQHAMNAKTQRGLGVLFALGRLRHTVSREQAHADLVRSSRGIAGAGASERSAAAAVRHLPSAPALLRSFASASSASRREIGTAASRDAQHVGEPLSR
jgi:hypothetical protein